MTKRERMLATLRRETPDKISWGADLSYWRDSLARDGLLQAEYQGDAGCFRMHRDLGAGFYLQGFFPFKTLYEGVDVKEEVQGKLRTTRIDTPKGTLTELWEYMPQTYSEAPREHLIKDADDLPALLYLYEHTHYEPDYARVESFREGIGDNGVVLCYTPKSPFMELVALKAGIESLTYAIADDAPTLDALLAVMAQKHMEASRLTLACGCDCVMVPENLSSEVVGKAYYETYMRAYHNRITSLIRDAGKFSFIHMDGTLGSLIREVSGAGFDVLEALTPAPTGDISIEEIAALAHPDAIVWGGLPGGYFTGMVSDGEFDRTVKQVLGVLCRRPHSALGVADQVVPGALPQRIRRVNELVEAFGELHWEEIT